MIKLIFFISILIFESVVIYLVKNNISDEYFYSIVFITINYLLFISFILYKNRLPIWFFKSIFVIYGLKVLTLIFMYEDINVYINFFNIWDVGGYHPNAIAYMSGNGDNVQFYSKCVALIYVLYGIVMAIPVFFNVIVSLVADIYFYKLLKLEFVDSFNVKVFTILFMLLPWRNLQSLFLLREAIPTSLFVISLYYFLRYFKTKLFKDLCVSLLLSIFMLAFHAGLIVMPLLILLHVIFYDKRQEKLCLNRMSVIKGLSFGMGILCVIILFGDVIFYKLLLVLGQDDDVISMWSQTVMNNAGSVYLEGLSYNSAVDIIWQSPIRMIYFLFSPMIWNVRGLMDIFALMIDSSVHIIGIVYILYNSFIHNYNNKVIKMVFFIYIATALVFGVGTFDSGTAMRHRAKFTSAILICVAIVYSGKKFNVGKLPERISKYDT